MTTEIYKFPSDYFEKRIQTALAAAARIGQPSDSFDFVSTSPVIRHLHSAAYDRFLSCFPVKCSECGVLLPVNPTSDGFLFCAGCGVYWDLLSRSTETTRKIRVLSFALMVPCIFALSLTLVKWIYLCD